MTFSSNIFTDKAMNSINSMSDMSMSKYSVNMVAYKPTVQTKSMITDTELSLRIYFEFVLILASCGSFLSLYHLTCTFIALGTCRYLFLLNCLRYDYVFSLRRYLPWAAPFCMLRHQAFDLRYDL